MARRAGSRRKSGASAPGHGPSSSAPRPYQPSMLAPGRVHEGDPPVLADGAHTLAEAAGDDRELLALPAHLPVELGVGQGHGAHRGQGLPTGRDRPSSNGSVRLRPATPSQSVRSATCIGSASTGRSGRSSVSVTSGACSSVSAEARTAVLVSSMPMERFTSSVAPKRPRRRARSVRSDSRPARSEPASRSDSTASAPTSAASTTTVQMGAASARPRARADAPVARPAAIHRPASSRVRVPVLTVGAGPPRRSARLSAHAQAPPIQKRSPPRRTSPLLPSTGTPRGNVTPTKCDFNDFLPGRAEIDSRVDL